MSLTNKNIVLTGASSGIGAQILKLLAQHERVKIVAVARNIENIPSSFNNVFALSADMSTQQGVDDVFEYAKNIFGHIDVFIANAGFAYLEKLEKPSWRHIQNIYSLNLTSVIYSLEKLNMQEKGSPSHFVCSVSAVAFVPLHAYALYCSSKAGLHQFIEAYRYEKDENMSITAIYPVATKTSFFDHASGKEYTLTPWPTQSVEKVALKIVNGIERKKKRIYPSLLFKVFYPFGRAFPIFLRMYTLFEKRKTEKWLAR